MSKGRADKGNFYTYLDGVWYKGAIHNLGPANHAVWLSSVVFDGARYFDGVAPDLDRHCARVINSARLLGMDPMLSAGEIENIAWDGIHRFPSKMDLYVSPMFFAEEGFITPDPASTKFALLIWEAPLPAGDGFSACKSSFRRPARDMAPTEAKASCLYPNVGRCVREAAGRGFDTAVVLDPSGNVAEFAYTNLFMVKDGMVHTPAPNGTFLNGITRQRVVALLRKDGIAVSERAIDFDELLDADELFASGNYAKVQPCIRLEDKSFDIGPVYTRVRSLYMDYAQATAKGHR